MCTHAHINKLPDELSSERLFSFVRDDSAEIVVVWLMGHNKKIKRKNSHLVSYYRKWGTDLHPSHTASQNCKPLTYVQPMLESGELKQESLT